VRAVVGGVRQSITDIKRVDLIAGVRGITVDVTASRGQARSSWASVTTTTAQPVRRVETTSPVLVKGTITTRAPAAARTVSASARVTDFIHALSAPRAAMRCKGGFSLILQSVMGHFHRLSCVLEASIFDTAAPMGPQHEAPSR
jgi:hypothetical protein